MYDTPDSLLKRECERFPLKKIDQRFFDTNTSIPVKVLGGNLYTLTYAIYNYTNWRNELFFEILEFKKTYTGNFDCDGIEDVLQVFEWFTKALTFEERLDAIEIINKHRDIKNV